MSHSVQLIERQRESSQQDYGRSLPDLKGERHHKCRIRWRGTRPRSARCSSSSVQQREPPAAQGPGREWGEPSELAAVLPRVRPLPAQIGRGTQIQSRPANKVSLITILCIPQWLAVSSEPCRHRKPIIITLNKVFMIWKFNCNAF